MDLERLSNDSIAIVAITKEAGKLASRLSELIKNSRVYLSKSIHPGIIEEIPDAEFFEKVSRVFPKIWSSHNVIICIMATGIVVRTIAPLLGNKASDPAVVVLDEKGRFAISLLSGHVGGANEWAQYVASLLNAIPVITTSSDVQGKRALDVMAKDKRLTIVESYGDASLTLASTMRRLLDGETVWIFDPENRISTELAHDYPSLLIIDKIDETAISHYGIWVSEKLPPNGLKCLRLHPKNLLVGVGCNRGTLADEIISLIKQVFREEELFLGSIEALVSIEIKCEEEGLRQAAKGLGVPLKFVSRSEINSVTVPNPSFIVEKHIGVKGVCEAAPIALNPSAQLIVPKRKFLNATVAVARVPFQL